MIILKNQEQYLIVKIADCHIHIVVFSVKCSCLCHSICILTQTLNTASKMQRLRLSQLQYNYWVSGTRMRPHTTCRVFCPVDQYLRKVPVEALKAYLTSAILVQPQVARLVCF